MKSILRMCQMPDLFSTTLVCIQRMYQLNLCGESFASSEQATANNVNASLGIQIGTMSRREF